VLKKEIESAILHFVKYLQPDDGFTGLARNWKNPEPFF